MKKTILSLGILSAMAFAANAQDAATAATSSSELKAGNVTVELNMSSPFATTSDPFTLSQDNTLLRFRYFLGETTALRLGFGINRDGFTKTFGGKTEASSTTNGTSNSGSTTDDKVVVKSSSFTFSILPGIEKHVLVSERLSAYYGAVAELSINSRKASFEATPGEVSSAGNTTPNSFGTYKEEWKGASLESDFTADDVLNAVNGNGARTFKTGGLTKAEDGAFTRYGLSGVIGADYYFTKGLYLGVEVSWGITGTSYKKQEHKITDNNTPAATGTTGSSTTKDIAGNKTGVITPAANASFRFGFRF